MCTAISWNGPGHYFGRNLDLEDAYRETVVITPRNCALHFRRAGTVRRHYAFIGMAHVADGIPLYYDGVNERGLAAAGLSFPGCAVYRPARQARENVAPFELIAWLLGQCATVAEARRRIAGLNLLAEPFSGGLPLTPLHWMLSDRVESVVLEPLESGLRLYPAAEGVLTNSPPLPFHQTYLSHFHALSPEEPSPAGYSRGMGALGLPGDWSSASRFVRAAFVRQFARPGGTEEESVGRFFGLLDAVAMPRGCVRPDGVGDVYTRYACCCSTERGIYYYKTHENCRVTAVALDEADPEGAQPVCIALRRKPDFDRLG